MWGDQLRKVYIAVATETARVAMSSPPPVTGRYSDNSPERSAKGCLVRKPRLQCHVGKSNRQSPTAAILPFQFAGGSNNGAPAFQTIV